MVFSFFKKAPEKMVAKPAVAPRSHEVRDEKERPDPSSVQEKSGQVASPAVAEDDLPPLEFSDFVFSESFPDFQIEEEIDPVDATAEEAAVLFSNGQDEAVCSLLESAVRTHQSGPAERLWLMLFDLYRLLGQNAPFEALEIEYARIFEKSAPAWHDKSKSKPKTKEAVAGSLLFRGNLTGDNSPAFDAIQQALDKNPRLRLDLTKVASLDAEGCGRLLLLLQKARKSKRELELLGRDTLGALVEVRVETGRAEDKDCWLLLLELCQLQGQLEAFEEMAINYAVTFEVSPPSWEASRVATPEPVFQMALVDDVAGEDVDAYLLRGDVKASRFGDLLPFADAHDPVVIDCASLTRMDFISAGALLNSLTIIGRTGKQVVFRHPNHLVAELFSVVGLNAVATIVFAKN